MPRYLPLLLLRGTLFASIFSGACSGVPLHALGKAVPGKSALQTAAQPDDAALDSVAGQYRNRYEDFEVGGLQQRRRETARARAAAARGFRDLLQWGPSS